MKTNILYSFLALQCLALTACGGSGGGGADPQPITAPVKPPPVSDQTPCGVLKANEQCLSVNNRNFLLISPASKKASSPIVLAFYGAPPSYGTPQELDAFLALHQLADAKNYLIALPLGAPDWVWDSDVQPGGVVSYDTTLSLAIIDKLVNEHQADGNKVATVGFSAGAMMSYQLACQMPHRVKAAFTVAGQLRGNLQACTPNVPVVLHHLHGTADQDMPLGGRVTQSGNVINSLDGTIKRFLQINGCSSTKTDSAPFAITSSNQLAVTTSYQGCLKPTQLTLVEGGVHHPEYLKPVLHQLLEATFNSGF